MKSIILQRTALAALVALGILINWASVGFAQTKPLSDLPQDVVMFSTGWTEIPKQMYQAGQESGTIAGVARGSAEGAGNFVTKTARGIWNVLKPNPEHQAGRLDQPSGLAFRYAF